VGQYATYLGDSAKIGTCEDMYYLRAYQREQVSGWDGDWSTVRFRFPWPDEGAIEPGGDFKDHKRSLALPGISPPPELAEEHHAVQFIASAGYNVCLPCPESGQTLADAEGRPLTIHRNGCAGAVCLVQQRLWEGLLIALLECGACGLAWRLETHRDATPALDVLIRESERGDAGAPWYRAVAERLAAGYGPRGSATTV
jgi:hypothetical protein